MMKRLFTLLTVLFVLTLPMMLYAQGPPLFPDDPEQTPIDGGLGVLAAAGGAYALKKLRDKKSE